MKGQLLPIGERELIEVLREGLHGGADCVHFRPGCAPLGTTQGSVLRLGGRALSADDMLAITEILLRRCYVPDSAAEGTCDAAHALAMLCELRDEALIVPHLGRDDSGLFIVVELARPLGQAATARPD